jgi:protocatechuate 3,4-dioxygenase beta subunit
MKHAAQGQRGPKRAGIFALETLESRDCPAILFAGFIENSPTDPTPLLGTTPTIIGPTASFDPVGFQSAATPSTANDTTSSFLLFNVNATGQSTISKVRFDLSGDATVVGNTNSFAAAGVSANLFVRVTQINGSTAVNLTRSVPIVFNPNNGQFSLANGGNQIARIFSGTAEINIDTLLSDNSVVGQATKVEVNVQTLLNTDASANGSSFIQIKTGQAVVTEGERPLGSIGRIIFRDLDCNGQQGESEPGINGVRVFLDSAGTDGVFGTSDDQIAVQEKITGTDGLYSFDNLPPGTYRVRVDLNSAALTNFTNTADPDGVKDATFVLTTSAPDNLNPINANFGFNDLRGSIGDRVWLDQNSNGIQDLGEPGIVGATVRLLYAGADGIFGNSDDVTSNATTGSDGIYSFANLTPGRYRVSVVTSSLPGIDFFPTFDRDLVANSTTDLTLEDCQNLTDVDFGYNRYNGQIGDTIFRDRNGNRTQDPGENGIAGVIVQLRTPGPNGILNDADDLIFNSAPTDANGKYLFTNLPPGDFQVVVPTGQTPLAGLVNTADPDNVGTNGDNKSAVTLTTSALVNLNQDFGYQAPGRIGDTIYRDTNGNGSQDPGENGIANVIVQLWAPGPNGTFGDSDDVITNSAPTNSTGSYLFQDLPLGPYRVVVPNGQAALAGLINTGDPDSPGLGGDGRSALTLTQANPVNLNQDFGYNDSVSQSQAVLAGAVYVDTNNNGIIDAGETGIPNVTITLINAATRVVVQTKVTDANGLYSFVGLPAGIYRIVEGPTPGYIDGKDTVGTLGSASNDNDQFNSILLPANQIGVGYNFGELGLSNPTKRLFLASSLANPAPTALAGLQNLFGDSPTNRQILQASANPTAAGRPVFTVADFGGIFGIGGPNQVNRSRTFFGNGSGSGAGSAVNFDVDPDRQLVDLAHDLVLEDLA